MKISTIMSKMFGGGLWVVGYKEKSSENLEYIPVVAPEGSWIADPFLYETDGKHYLFVEQYIEKDKRASIAYYEFVNGTPIFKKVIIRQNYHMSYPCVFYFDGEHYMIPETSANQTVELYKAEHFPDVWKKETTLIENKHYVDSTVCFYDAGAYLFCYKKDGTVWKLDIFYLNMKCKSVSFMQSVSYVKNVGRPAGNFFVKNGRLFRMSQDCRERYGKALIINEILDLDENKYSEKESEIITAENIRMPIKFQRVHTLNTDSKYEVVDVYQEKFDMWHAVKILKRKNHK